MTDALDFDFRHHTGSEMIHATIAVDLLRSYFKDGDAEWTELTFVNIRNTANPLTPAEQSYMVEQVCESSQEEEIVNALLDALAGRHTNL